MNFNLNNAIEILERTPRVLETYLANLSEEWTKADEGKNTWSPYDIVGHLIFGEKTDWIPRAKIILNNSNNKIFEPFDRFAQLEEDQSITIESLLKIFSELRESNIQELKSLNIASEDLLKTGIHPEFGEVTLQQLLSTWVAHDLGHIAQISRVMAKQYKGEVGPWVDYLGILKH